jgi:hypothetical protein
MLQEDSRLRSRGCRPVHEGQFGQFTPALRAGRTVWNATAALYQVRPVVLNCPVAKKKKARNESAPSLKYFLHSKLEGKMEHANQVIVPIN